LIANDQRFRKLSPCATITGKEDGLDLRRYQQTGRRRRSPQGICKTMTMLTAAECREKAYQKMMEAKSDRVLGKKLEETAEAWLALADQIERADLLGTFAGPKAKK
jgi:hypothetical protein